MGLGDAFGAGLDALSGGASWAYGAMKSAGNSIMGQSGPAPNGPQYNWDDANQMRGYGLDARQGQGAVADRLTAQAEGRGPSVAQSQLAQARDANIQGYNAQAASARGGASAHMLAQRTAMDQSAQAQQQTAAQAATLRAQEVASANQQLGALYGQQRGQDIQGQQLDQSRQLEVGSQGVQMAGIQAQMQMANAKNAQSGIGNLASMGGAALGMLSDERAKTDIKPADSEMRGFMSAIEPRRFEYRSEPGAQHYGVIAQDMERSPVGAVAVHEVNGYKRIDPQEAQSITLAALANLNKRLAAVEKK